MDHGCASSLTRRKFYLEWNGCKVEWFSSCPSLKSLSKRGCLVPRINYVFYKKLQLALQVHGVQTAATVGTKGVQIRCNLEREGVQIRCNLEREGVQICCNHQYLQIKIQDPTQACFQLSTTTFTVPRLFQSFEQCKAKRIVWIILIIFPLFARSGLFYSLSSSPWSCLFNQNWRDF